MPLASKPTVLVFVGQYLPGFKAGGILRSVENLVNHLHEEFAFRIVTRDRDLGDAVAYADVPAESWVRVGHALVYYLPPPAQTAAALRDLLAATPHDLIHLNSFFEPLTVKVLLNRRLGRIPPQPIVLSPRGEFAPASLHQKYPKKVLFMALARLGGLYRQVTWHASSTFEAEEITAVMKVPAGAIRTAMDLPSMAAAADMPAAPARPRDGELRVVFLSRISAEKNLDFALKVLQRVRSRVDFDIIGPIENAAYWRECEKLIPGLPAHVRASAKGPIHPSKVAATLAEYDVLLFPSGGENYGHVIAEALGVGTPVLISTNTPWRNLAAKELGWDLPLADIDGFVRVIDDLGAAPESERLRQRMRVKRNFGLHVAIDSLREENRQLYRTALATGENPGGSAR